MNQGEKKICFSTKFDKVLVKKLRYERWTNTRQNVKMNPFGLSERMVYVFTFQVLFLITDSVSRVSP